MRGNNRSISDDPQFREDDSVLRGVMEINHPARRFLQTVVNRGRRQPVDLMIPLRPSPPDRVAPPNPYPVALDGILVEAQRQAEASRREDPRTQIERLRQAAQFRHNFRHDSSQASSAPQSSSLSSHDRLLAQYQVLRSQLASCDHQQTSLLRSQLAESRHQSDRLRSRLERSEANFRYVRSEAESAQNRFEYAVGRLGICCEAMGMQYRRYQGFCLSLLPEQRDVLQSQIVGRRHTIQLLQNRVSDKMHRLVQQVQQLQQSTQLRAASSSSDVPDPVASAPDTTVPAEVSAFQIE